MLKIGANIMRLFILSLLALVLISAGSVGVSTSVYASEKPAAEGEDTVEFVELPALTLPIVDNTGVTQTVNLVVALEVADAAAVAKVEKYKPRLIDAFIQEMYGVLNQHAALKGGVIQVGYIKEKLKVISNEILGEGVVNHVLLQVVQQRPI